MGKQQRWEGRADARVDHSNIRGSEPHNRDPSGAACDEKERVRAQGRIALKFGGFSFR